MFVGESQQVFRSARELSHIYKHINTNKHKQERRAKNKRPGRDLNPGRESDT
jgi:hypothetical protein